MSINGEKKKSQRDTSNVIAKYELYGSRQSYFTQKYSLRNLPRLLFRLDYLHRKD